MTTNPVYWQGWVKRKSLQEIFGVSLAQSSSDLQKYQELNPGAMVYDLSRKRYEAADGMVCVLHAPQFENALWSFLPAGSMGLLPSMEQMGSDAVALVRLPNRTGKPEVQRMVLQAFLNSKKMRLKYYSVDSGKAKLREIVPSGFGNDGYRWHVRAWCCENEDYRDFVLGRISLVKEMSEIGSELSGDDEWAAMEVVRFRPNSKLSDNARRAIELDYGIRRNGVLKVEVRSAMKYYLLAHMRVSDVKVKSHFELA